MTQVVTNSGKAYIFNVTSGALVHTLDNPNAYGTSETDYFGWALQYMVTTAIVGAFLKMMQVVMQVKHIYSM